MPYDVSKIRNQLMASQNKSDPDEFKPPKVDQDKTANYRFIILPPYGVGDVLRTGKASRGLDQFFLAHGNHWINSKPHACPRIIDVDKCPLCDFGFQLMSETQDKDQRRIIAKTWLANAQYMVNIYFTNWEGNGDYAGKVMYYNAPKKVYDKWKATIMREDAGDPDDPKAFGVFFDEVAAYVFNLEATRQGDYNNYDSSKFLPRVTPLARNDDGSPNLEAIKRILAQRHDLFGKIAKPDMQKLNNIKRILTDGDDGSPEDGEESVSFTDEATSAVSTASTQQLDAETQVKAKGTSSVASESKSPKTTAKAEVTVETKADDDAPFDSDDLLEEESVQALLDKLGD